MVIADTGPINYLVLIGAVHVLPALFGHVVIPSAVSIELQQAKTPPLVQAWIAAPPLWLEVRSAQMIKSPDMEHLGAGELEAILLAEEMRPD